MDEGEVEDVTFGCAVAGVVDPTSNYLKDPDYEEDRTDDITRDFHEMMHVNCHFDNLFYFIIIEK